MMETVQVSVGLKVIAAFAVVVAIVAVVALAISAFSGGKAKTAPRLARLGAEKRDLRSEQKIEEMEASLAKARRQKATRQSARRRQMKAETRAASAGSNGSPGQSPVEGAPATPKRMVVSSQSFSALEGEIPGEIGVAYASLGSAQSQMLGPLQVGHAWSSFKVPISVTLMLEQGGSLNSSQESLVASAITASDNEAAATLFSELESATGGHASEAVERTLEKAEGAAVEVATAPPPPGAVSSWGQTEWPLSASTSFYGALACDAFGGATDTILGDMENVIPEQQWGMGQASFPSGTSVAIKAGWGPDGSESGPYLVRQAGIIHSPEGGAVITIAAQDVSGSFESGVADLDRVADWVAENIPLSGSC
jgi:hypothetical protein